MSTPYRNEQSALRAKKQALETELEQLHGQREATGRALELAEQVEREIALALDEVDERKPTPLLDRVRIAKPCDVPWSHMQGDDVTRHCGSCKKNVHNVSAMTKNEAEAFLAAQAAAGEKPCITYYRRLDGTLISEDCPVGAGRVRRKKLVLFATVAAAAAAVATQGLSSHEVGVQTAGDIAPAHELP